MSEYKVDAIGAKKSNNILQMMKERLLMQNFAHNNNVKAPGSVFTNYFNNNSADSSIGTAASLN